MKERMNKLSMGIYEYETPDMELSVSEIQLTIGMGIVYNGEFRIFSSNDVQLKGICYATDELFTVSNGHFIGTDHTIHYSFNTMHLDEPCKRKGHIHIVSNGGEISVPFEIDVVQAGIGTSAGQIFNRFHFANLVQTNYEEAKKIFYGEAFKEVFLKKDMVFTAIYEGLCAGASKDIAMEEFLIAMHMKSPVILSLSETTRVYNRLTESYGDRITVSKSSWGYVSIQIITEGDFIIMKKKRLTSEDFAGSRYELEYLIDTEKLHAGKNDGRIILETVGQRLVLNITATHMINRKPSPEQFEIKKCLYNLGRRYITYRMNPSEIKHWAKDSLALIERARGFDDSDLWLKLIHAQILIAMDKRENASWLLENVAEEILDIREEHIELYSYYLYVRTLEKKEVDAGAEEHTRIEIKEQLVSYFENGYDTWQTLWVLFSLDDAYDNNKSLKLARIKEQFTKGCTSPLMYFEALSVLNEMPMLLRVLNSFELQILYFGAKNKGIDIKLALKVAELAMLEKGFRGVLYKILTQLYERFEDKEILAAICSILIKGNVVGKLERKDQEYFKWFQLGIAAELKLTNLCEYYMFAMSSDYTEPLPQMIQMYFIYNSSQLHARQALLYKNMIINKELPGNVYKNYVKNMELYAIEQMMLGNMNEHLAILYKEFFNETMLNSDIAKKFPDIVHTYKIEVTNPNIYEIVVIHKEYKTEQRIRLTKTNQDSFGKGYVKIYTEDPLIISMDKFGNRYCKSIEYKLTRLSDMHRHLMACLPYCGDNELLLADFAEKSLKYQNAPVKAIDIFEKILAAKNFRGNYKQTILHDLIHYYYDNYDGDRLDSYLKIIDYHKMDRETRSKTAELLIIRGLYEEALQVFIDYGNGGINARRLVKFCSRIIQIQNFKEDEVILNLCIYAFRKGKYNQTMIEYLLNYYNGSTREMLDIWEESKAFSCEDREFEERLIAQILFSKTYLPNLSEVYDVYWKKGANERLKKAYLFHMAYDYFVKEVPISDLAFVHLDYELQKDMKLFDVCIIAYMKYCSGKEKLSDMQIEICENGIRYFETKRIQFNFFKHFKKWFHVPYYILDRMVVEYRTDPEKRVWIHYIPESDADDGKSYAIEEMRAVFPGLYIKEFIIFYTDNILYYITEEDGADRIVTESKNLVMDDRDIYVDESRYGMLNEISICMDMRDDIELKDIACAYAMKKELLERLLIQ